MTAENLSDSLRQRLNKGVSGNQGPDAGCVHSQNLVQGKMVLTNRSFCFRHRWKILGTIIGIILIGGLIASITIALSYYKSHGYDPACLRFLKAQTCLTTDPIPYRLFGTKTDYNVAKVDFVTPNPSSVSGCVPVHFYLLSRHGIRYPDADDIAEMGKKLPEIQSKIKNSNICGLDLTALNHWRFQMTAEDDNHVSLTGKLQTQEIAKKFQKMFPSLLSETYSPSTYEFAITSKPRTKETAAAFSQGLFHADLANISYPVKDELLHFSDKCSEILKHKGDIGDKAPEVKKFKTGDLMKLTVADVSTRIGVRLSFDEMKLLLRACAFDFVLNQNKSSPWCAVFHKNNIRVMEYYEDLDDFYDDAYGNPRNYKQACPVIKDLIEQLTKAINSTPRKALLYFSHAGVMKKVYAHFGLFKDNLRYTADRFCNNVHRKWRSSRICPFSSNLAVVLFKCAGKYFVQVYVQEKPVIVEGCQETLCPWTDFEKKYSATSAKCNLESICVR